MISYDNYKNRIQKLAKLKRILHKFRFLICGVLALIVGTSVGLMVAKGSYTSGMSLSAQVVMFNEDYDVKAASAFLASSSDQYIEYRAEGGDWTKQKPVKAGKYSARTVTKKLVGYSYSPAVNFEILPLEAEFTIVAASVEYGGIPKYTMPQLISGHRVDESVLEFGYETYGAPSTEVNVVESSIKIIDANGDDFTQCYVITPHGNTLTVNKRSITVKTADCEFEYDGKSHFAGNDASEETLTRLVKGDALTLTTAVGNYTGVLENGAVNAGGYTVSCENIKIMHGDTDISDWYNISPRTSQLTINRRTITLTTKNTTKVYDGTPAENTKFDCANLVEGHVAAVDTATLPKNTGVGTYRNEFGVTVFDGTTDVSRNYEIDKDNSKYGELTITPRPIVVELSTIDGVTYGETFKYTDEAGNYANSPDLANGEKLKIAVVYKQNGLIVTPKNAGAYSAELDLENCAFYKADGTKIEGGVNNYSIECAPLENLKINKFEFIIKPLDLTKGNGTAFTYGDEVKYPDYIGNYFGLSSKEAGTYDITELPYGEQIKILAGAAADKLNVGKYKITASSIALFDSRGNAIPFNDNYSCISSELADLEIVPRKITVTVDDKTAPYGEALPENSFTVTEGALQYGEKLTITSHYERGGVTYTPETWEGYTLLNAGIYSIVDNNDAEIVGGNARVDNYDITYIYGTLEITKRVIYYVTADGEKVYDGTALYNTGYETYLLSDDTKAGLLKEDELTVLENPTSIVDVQKRPNHNYYTAPNNNYYIDNSATIFGWLEVTPRPVIVYNGSATKTYDGAPLENAEYDDVKFAVQIDGKWVADESKIGLVEGDGLQLIGDAVSITNAGEKENANKYENPNYDIKDYLNGTLKIEKYKVEIALRKDEVYYYGYTLSNDMGTSFFLQNGTQVLGEDVLVNGEELNVRYKFSQNGEVVWFKNAGTYTTVPYKFIVYDADNNIIDGGENNYDITCAEGKDVIRPRKVTVTIEDKTIAYGDALPENSVKYVAEDRFNGNISVEKLSFNEILIPDYKYSPENPKEVGTYDITANTCKVYDRKGALIEGGDENYEITYVGGTLNIEQRTLYIATASASKVYDGKPLTAKNPKYYALDADGQQIAGLAKGHTLKATFIREVTNATVDEEGNVTPVDNDSRYTVVDGDGYDVSGKYDIVYLTDGTLTVTQASLTVKFWYNVITRPERIYYGTEWSYSTGAGNYKEKKDSVSGLVNGEEIEFVVIVFDGVTAERVEKPVKVGKYSINLDRKDSKIYAADGSEIENGIRNYKISVMSGNLSVEGKPITINFADNAATYGDDLTDFIPAYTTSLDGNMPYDESFTFGGFTYLLNGVEAPEKKNAGEYEIEGKDLVFYDKDGNEIANGERNYNITYEGVLAVNKKQVHIRFEDKTLEYGFEYLLQGLATLDSDLELSDGSTEPALAYGEVLRVVIGYKKDGVAIGGEHHAGNPWRLSVGEYTRYAVEYCIKENEDVKWYIDRGLELKNYEITCEEGALEITPYTVTVKPNDRTCVYGTPEDEIEDTGFEYTDGWTVDHDGLPYGENLILSYSYDPSPVKNVGTYTIKATATGVEGGDLENYEVSYEDGELRVKRKEIIIRLDNKTCTYGDGLPENTYKIFGSVLSETEYVLPNGDEFAVTEYLYRADDSRVTPRNAGVYVIGISTYTFTDKDGEDASANYSFGYVGGTLTINKADLHIVFNSVSSYYENVKSYAKQLGNYDKKKTTGTVNEEQFELSVKYEMADDIYGGGLHEIGTVFDSVPTNAGVYNILLDEENSLAYTSDGEEIGNIALNYNVTFDNGTFSILQSIVHVTLSSPTYTYGETVESPLTKFGYGYHLDDGSQISRLRLPHGDELVMEFIYEDEEGNTHTQPKNAGKYKLSADKIYVNDSEAFARNNYFFLYHDADKPGYLPNNQALLTINKKQIEITLDDMTVAYGDFEFTQPQTHTFSPTEGVLEYTDQLKVNIKFTQVGNESAAEFITPKNVGGYSVVATQFGVTYSDGTEETAAGDKLKNYEIVCNHGTLEITKKQLHIALSKEVETVYGEAVPDHSQTPYTVTSDGEIITRLPYNDPLGVACYYGCAGVPVNAGTYTIVYDGAAINLGAGDFNYEIDGEDGLLTIKQREIEVAVKGGTAVYGFEKLPEIAHEIKSGTMADGEKLVPAYSFGLDGEPCSPVNVGVYDIAVNEEECRVQGGNALYKNYKVTYVIEGKLEITASPLTVKIIGDSFVYGERGVNVTFEITAGELYHGDELRLTYKYNNESAEPTAAGTYAITATAEIVGGNASADNYDISYVDNDPTLTISQREITVTLNKGGATAFTYGEKYDEDICYAQINGVADGQIITVAVTYAKKQTGALRMLRARTFSAREAEAFIPKDAGAYIATLDFEACVVKGADGNPVDGGIDNYRLSADCAAVEFVISPMTLTVTVENAQITYGDRLPATLDYGVKEEMPYGEKLNLTFSFSGEDEKLPVHKGDYDVTVTSAEVNGGNIGNYELDYTNKAPTLTINAKPLAILLGNLSVSYGAEVSYEVKVGNYEIADGLLDGDELTVTEILYKAADGTEYGEANPPANVGTYAIVYVNCTIVNADGENAKGDYDVTGLDGVLVIDSSLITVYTASAEKEYDGTALSTDKYDRYDGDLGDYVLVADKDNIREQTDATSGDGVDNTTEFKIVDKSGKVTQNLKLQYGTYGKLKVTRKTAEITIKDTSAVYGEYPEIEHTATGLVDGEEVDFSVEFSDDEDIVTPETRGGYFILPVGNYRINYAENSASIVGGRGKASNYNLVFKPDAAFGVTPRHIAVTTASDSAEYSGSAFFKTDGYTTEWVVDGERQGLTGLINGDTLTVANVAYQTDYGSCDNACTYTASDNYFIEEDMYAYGTLTVTQRTITAKTADVIETYDGEAHSGGVVTDVDNKLAAGHEFRVASALVERVDVCSNVKNELTVIIVDTNDGDRDVTGNYKITYRYGKITVNPRPLEITTGGITVAEYDGTAYGNTAYDKADGLLTELGHELKVEDEFTYTNATEGVNNETTYKVYCGGEDISGNYDIDYKYGKIVIGKKSVTVTLNGGVQVQYGNDYAEALTDGAVTLIDGETVKLAITVDGAVSGVGTYTARADWANSVVSNAKGEIKDGIDNYAPEFVPATVEFDVISRKIKVTLNAGGKTQFAYGDDYDTAIRTVTVDSMVAGETLEVAVTYNIANPKYVGNYSAALDWSGCSVTGGNVKNYNVVLCDDVDFEICAREITVDMEDITVRYGETPAYPDGVAGYTVDRLVYGDTVEVVPAFEKDGERVIPDFAGEYDIVCGGIVVNGGAVDAENYTFKTGKKGTLTIEGIGIEIVRKTVTKTYDGTPLALDSDAPESQVTYIINNDESLKLREGYSLVLDGAFATKDGNVSSSCANTAKYKVLNADGDEAGEYVVSHQTNDAKLIIEKRIILVKTDTPDARDYDGTVLKAEGCEITDGELVEGHELKTSGHATLTDAGSIDNTMIITVTAGNEVVTANYDIQVTCGTLTVNKLKVEVNIESVSKVYGENTGTGIYRKTLVNGEKLIYRLKYLKGDETCTGLLSVDTYGIAADKGTMSVSGGKLSNYDIIFNDDATLTVTRRHIIVTTANGEEEYGGTAFSKTDDYTTEWIKDGVKQGESGLINGDTLTVTEVVSRTEVGSSENACKYVVTENAENYYIEDYVNGTLTVKRRVISVTTEGISGEYRGTPYTEGGFGYDQTKLLAGHTVARTGELIGFLDVTDDAENVFAVKITENGEDVTDNYKIDYTYGKVVITKRTLTVTLNGTETSFKYGDNSFDGKFKNVTVDGLAADDKLTTVALVYEPDGTLPVNAGGYTAKLDLANSFVTYAGEGNGIGNYNVVCADVEFTITKRSVTLTLGEWAAEEYDGEEHVYNTNGCGLVTALLNGESLASVAVKYCLDSDGKVALGGAPTNAGTYYVFLDTAQTTVNGANGEWAIETNYAVTCEPLEFEITPKKLVITLSDVSHTYDGNRYDFASGDGFETNLCDGDEIECNVNYDKEPVKVGTYAVTFDENLVFTSGISGNYELDKASSTLGCTLTVNKLEITVTVADRDVEKGNEEYTKADISGGFVAGDLAKAEAEFVYTDGEGNVLSGVPEDTGTYTVTVTLGGEVMDNYDCTVNAGTLTVTERKVLVTPVFSGEAYTYSGTAVDASLFGYTHVHNVAGADGEAGFFDKDLGNVKATYTFTDENGNKFVGTTPTVAGTYTLSVEITTLSGGKVAGYHIEYEETEFIIARRELSYTVEVEGAGEYVYSNSRPAFGAELSAYDGFVGGEVPADMSYVLFDANNEVVTRYNVGEYYVGIYFAGISNYDVKATTAQIKITQRTIVVTPTDPFGGAAQTYNGTNLKLGENDFTLRYGETANGDKLTIVSSEFAPTSKSGNITIVGVNIVDAVSGEDVKGNYTVYYVYNATNATIKGLGLSSIDFRVRAEYTQTDVHYTVGNVFGEDTGTFPYTGKSFVYTFDGSKISKALNFGHYVKVDRNTVTVPAAAGVYPDLITERVKVYDGNGNNVTAIYNLICDNPEAAKITVTENVLTIKDLADVDVTKLISGAKLGCEVTGLYAGATPAHTAEVYAYNVDGEWIIGAVVFSTSASGRKTDLSANYKLDGNCTLDGATVKILTLDEAELYSRPVLGVEITVTAAQLAGGRDTLFTEDNGGRWVLGNSYYTVNGTLSAGHELQVLVFVDASGKYTLGVTVFKTENNRRIEAKNSYRLKDIRTTDVSASYITVSEASDLQRELYVDFSGCTIQEGLLTGYSVKGLNTADNHVIEVTATYNGDGTYALSVVVYQIKAGSPKKFNKATSYKLVFVAPSQVSGAALVTGALS